MNKKCNNLNAQKLRNTCRNKRNLRKEVLACYVANDFLAELAAGGRRRIVDENYTTTTQTPQKANLISAIYSLVAWVHAHRSLFGERALNDPTLSGNARAHPFRKYLAAISCVWLIYLIQLTKQSSPEGIRARRRVSRVVALSSSAYSALCLFCCRLGKICCSTAFVFLLLFLLCGDFHYTY